MMMLSNQLLVLLVMLMVLNNNTIFMLISVLLMTLVCCYLIWMLNKSPWFSYVLLLIFLGGMMVLFSYIISLSVNNISKIKVNLMIVMGLTFMMVLSDSFYNLQISLNQQVQFNKLFGFSMTPFNMILMSFLLLSLLLVISLAKVQNSPIRGKKFY